MMIVFYSLSSSQDPVRSLKDFSITLLLSELNSNAAALAYLHRGVVYTQLKWYECTDCTDPCSD